MPVTGLAKVALLALSFEVEFERYASSAFLLFLWRIATAGEASDFGGSGFRACSN